MPVFHAEVSEETRKKLDDMKINLRKTEDRELLEYFTKWWVEPGPIAETNATTVKAWLDIWLDNTRLNLPEIERSRDVKELFPVDEPYAGHAILIGGGPSIFEDDAQLRYIAENYHGGKIFCCDFAVKRVLECGIKPTHIVSVDAEVGVVAKFLDYPIVREKAKDVKFVLAVSSDPEAVKVVPGEKYFFTPAMDDRILPNVALTIYRLTNKVMLNPAFNVGAFQWILSLNMHIKDVLMVGMDHCYPADTPLHKTQKWDSFIQIIGGKTFKNQDGTVDIEWPCSTCEVPPEDCTEGRICMEKLSSFFFVGRNTFFNTDFLCDSSWVTMKNAFLKIVDLAKEDIRKRFNSEITLYNATPTGILFDEKLLPPIQLQDWVKHHVGPKYIA